MTNTQIETIINEVVRRVQLLASRKRALVLACGQVGGDSLKLLHDSLVSREFVFTKCVIGNKDPDYPYYTQEQIHVKETLDGSDPDNLVAAYDCVIAAGVPIAWLVALKELKVRGAALTMMYKALCQGKELYVFSRDLQLDAAPAYLKADIYSLISKLGLWGIKFPQIKEFSLNAMNRKMITLKDVQGLMAGPLIVRKDAVILSVAGKYLEERKIEVIRK